MRRPGRRLRRQRSPSGSGRYGDDVREHGRTGRFDAELQRRPVSALIGDRNTGRPEGLTQRRRGAEKNLKTEPWTLAAAIGLERFEGAEKTTKNLEGCESVSGETQRRGETPISKYLRCRCSHVFE